MFLEFAGIPGSGKTTLAAALANQLNCPGIHIMPADKALAVCLKRKDDGRIKQLVKRLPYRMWEPFLGPRFTLKESAVLASQNLDLVILAARTLADSGLPEPLTASIWYTLTKTFAEVFLLKRFLMSNELALMDEAFCQRGFTLFAYLNSPAQAKCIRHYVDLIPTGLCVIWVQSAPDTCVARFIKRYESNPLSPDFDLNAEELLTNFTQGHRVIEEICNRLKQKNCHVYQIQGDGSMTEALDQVNTLARKIQSQITGQQDH